MSRSKNQPSEFPVRIQEMCQDRNYFSLFLNLEGGPYARKGFGKTNISYPLVRTRTCTYQEVRNIARHHIPSSMRVTRTFLGQGNFLEIKAL